MAWFGVHASRQHWQQKSWFVPDCRRPLRAPRI